MTRAAVSRGLEQWKRIEIEPAWRWRLSRRITQSLAWVALIIGPMIGGWQRLDYTRERASWLDSGWGLPSSMQQLLPIPNDPEAVHAYNQLIGGGIASELFSIPFMDPLAGVLALLGNAVSLGAVIAVALPVVLALLFGRVFCGWFCPFGTLSRWIDALCVRLPHDRFIALPEQRWLRWVVLATAIVSSLLGGHLVLYLLLPYLLLSQSVYAAWLLGGGSAIVCVLAGLLVAGVFFGPTVYCAAVCPTGSALSLLGRARAFRLSQPNPSACGKHCDLCDRACWLQLKPSWGDPGPDCDLCARCVPSCPRTNLVVTRTPNASSNKTRAAAATLVSLLALLPSPAEARDERKPALVVDAEITRGDVSVSVAAIDFTGFRLDADWAVAESGVELSIFIARGPLPEPGADGIIASRETYRGPLRAVIFRAAPDSAEEIEFREPNSPISAERRRIYRTRLAETLHSGDRIRLEPIDGWFEEAIEIHVPTRGSGITTRASASYFAVSTLAFSALLSLAFIGRRRPARLTLREN